MRIVIGYASAAGSTRGIAEHLATRLEGASHVAVVDRRDEQHRIPEVGTVSARPDASA
jgi:flavodoxin